tara:strand:- start:1018 stop:1680 length:663 start_codon:yes stop_codon:yes gene_type:complete
MSIVDYYNKKKEFKIEDYYNISIQNERLLKAIEDKLTWFHGGIRHPLKAEYWEDIWDQCMNPDGSNWIGGGHQSGADTKHVNSNVSYQNKSGQIKGNNVEITSHRTKGAGPSMEEKLKFISKDHCDKYVLLSRDEKDWKKKIKSYNLMVFDSNIIDFKKLDWSPHIPGRGKNKGKHNGGYIGSGEPDKYSARIDGPGSSNQLHITINLDYIGGYHKFIIP